MTQNGSNIDFIDDIYFALFACMFRMTADYYSVYQFVAHLVYAKHTPWCQSGFCFFLLDI